MDANREKLLREVMAADFALIDLNLYLNTHPWDQNTINLHNQMSEQAKMLRSRYENLYGPLTAGTPSKCPWQWIECPWPWELA